MFDCVKSWDFRTFGLTMSTAAVAFVFWLLM